MGRGEVENRTARSLRWFIAHLTCESLFAPRRCALNYELQSCSEGGTCDGFWLRSGIGCGGGPSERTTALVRPEGRSGHCALLGWSWRAVCRLTRPRASA